MQCPACSVEVPGESLFCHKCGHRLSAEEQESPAGQADPGSSTAAFRERLAQGRGRELEAETELWRGGYSPKAMGGALVGAGVLTVVLVVGGLVLPGAGWKWLAIVAVALLMWAGLGITLLYRRMSEHYRLTNQRFVHESGIFRRVTDRIEVIDMDDITFEQGLIDRVFGVGMIKISSSDRTHPLLILTGIDKVGEIAELIDGTRRKERLRRGVHIEAI